MQKDFLSLKQKCDGGGECIIQWDYSQWETGMGFKQEVRIPWMRKPLACVLNIKSVLIKISLRD